MVKYKIAFMMGAETLFGLLSKFLPVEDLHVEEVMERSVPKQSPSPMPKMARQVTALKPPKRRRPRGLMLDAGINALIIEAMADGGTHRAVDLMPLLTARGYSANSVSSRLQSLREHGVVKPAGRGAWRLTEPMKQSA